MSWKQIRRTEINIVIFVFQFFPTELNVPDEERFNQYQLSKYRNITH